jgi:hypothetical protein
METQLKWAASLPNSSASAGFASFSRVFSGNCLRVTHLTFEKFLWKFKQMTLVSLILQEKEAQVQSLVQRLEQDLASKDTKVNISILIRI